MTKLEDYRVIENQENYYNQDGVRCIEVVKEDVISGKKHYLIDDSDNIIAGPVTVEGTTMLDKVQKFYVKNDNVIIGVAVIAVVGGTVLVLSRSTAVSQIAMRTVGTLFKDSLALINRFCPKASSEIAKKGIDYLASAVITTFLTQDQAKAFETLFHQSETIPPVYSDPLLVDLNGDGIKTTTLNNGTYFDHDLNGFAEKTAWVDANDGILAFDKNNNGTIDNGSGLMAA